METYTKFYKVAGITIQINSDFPITENTFHPRLKLFETHGPGKDSILVYHCFHIPDDIKVLKDEDAFSSRPMWTVFKLNSRWIFRKNPALPVSETDTVYFEFNNDFTNCTVYSDFLTQKEYKRGKYISLTIFGCDQLLITRLLADRYGFIMHANGFILDGKGRLLAGTSGTGKTTLTRMLKEQGIQIAGDDRMIVTTEGEKIQMHGSWLHGTNPVVSQGVNELDCIFFLEHSNENRIIPLKNKNKIFSNILQSIVRPYLSAEKWQILLKNAEKLAHSVSFYRLMFDLSGDIVTLMTDISHEWHRQNDFNKK